MDDDTEDEEDAVLSVKSRLLHLVVRVFGLKKKAREVDGNKQQSGSKCSYGVKSLLKFPYT